MSTLGGYQDACGGYHEYTGGVQYTGRTPRVHRGVFSTPEGYHETDDK